MQAVTFNRIRDFKDEIWQIIRTPNHEALYCLRRSGRDDTLIYNDCFIGTSRAFFFRDIGVGYRERVSISFIQDSILVEICKNRYQFFYNDWDLLDHFVHNNTSNVKSLLDERPRSVNIGPYAVNIRMINDSIIINRDKSCDFLLPEQIDQKIFKIDHRSKYR